MYVKDSVLWRGRHCGTMVDVYQVIFVNTIICQIHVSRLTTPLCNNWVATVLKSLSCWLWRWNSYLHSCRIPHFSRLKIFCFSDFRTRQFSYRCVILCRNEQFTKTFVKNLVRDPTTLLRVLGVNPCAGVRCTWIPDGDCPGNLSLGRHTGDGETFLGRTWMFFLGGTGGEEKASGHSQ
jgi:hypothetical protein